MHFIKERARETEIPRTRVPSQEILVKTKWPTRRAIRAGCGADPRRVAPAGRRDRSGALIKWHLLRRVKYRFANDYAQALSPRDRLTRHVLRRREASGAYGGKDRKEKKGEKGRKIEEGRGRERKRMQVTDGEAHA